MDSQRAPFAAGWNTPFFLHFLFHSLVLVAQGSHHQAYAMA